MSKPNDVHVSAQFTDIGASELRAFIETQPPSAIDALPYGVIRLDRTGKVVLYSRVEAQQSGFGDRQAIGHGFFTELAPCMASPEFLSRLERAQRGGALDIAFVHVGDFDDADRELRVRVISASDEGSWVFVQRLV